MKIKDMFGMMVLVPMAGAAIHSVGTHMVGSLKGIGSATQTLIAGGVLGKASKLFKR